jgi:hypothetical protein
MAQNGALGVGGAFVVHFDFFRVASYYSSGSITDEMTLEAKKCCGILVKELVDVSNFACNIITTLEIVPRPNRHPAADILKAERI